MRKAKLRRWSADLDPKLVKLIGAGMTVSDAAREMGFSRTTVGTQVKRLRLGSFRLITEEERDAVRRHHARGKSDRQIADAIGRSLGSVFKIRLQLGLEPNVRGKGKKMVKFVSGRYTLAELMRPTNHRPGTPQRADIENQRVVNGYSRNHPLDAT